MRLIKMFGLAALAAVAAMAFVGATSATATEWTELCYAPHEAELKCPAGQSVTEIHMEAINPLLDIKVLGVLIGVVCESSLALATVLALGKPQVAHITKLTWTNCKRESNSNPCVVTTNEPGGNLGLIDILKTKLDLGTAEALNVSATVACTGLPTCTYGGNPPLSIESALHQGASSGRGMLTAEAAKLTAEGGGLCPTTGLWTALYEPLPKHIYINS